MKTTINILMLLAVLGLAQAASAECKTDGDCKEGETCKEGACAAAEAPADKAEAKPEEKPEAASSSETEAKPEEAKAEEKAEEKTEAAPAAAAATAPAAKPAQPATPPPAIEVVAEVESAPSEGAEGEALPGPRGSGLAMGIAILDFVLAAYTLGAHVGAAVTYENDDGEYGEDPTAYALWGSSAATMAFMGPLSFYMGSKSIRKHNPEVEGSIGMRILGWSTFFLYMDLSLTGMFLGLADSIEEKSTGVALIGITAAFGVTSYLAFAIEALKCKKQAKAIQAQEQAAYLKPERNVVWSPIISPVYTESKTSGAVVGVGAYF